MALEATWRTLKHRYQAEGLDLDPNLLAVARQRYPEVRFHQADMVDFNLGRSFDAVVCLFSAIGYVVTLKRLRAAIAAMARHLSPGGVLLVEPWLTREGYTRGTVHALYVDQPELKLARINVSTVQGAFQCSISSTWLARRQASNTLLSTTNWVCLPTRSIVRPPSPPGSNQPLTAKVSSAWAADRGSCAGRRLSFAARLLRVRAPAESRRPATSRSAGASNLTIAISNPLSRNSRVLRRTVWRSWSARGW